MRLQLPGTGSGIVGVPMCVEIVLLPVWRMKEEKAIKKRIYSRDLYAGGEGCRPLTGDEKLRFPRFRHQAARV